MTVDNIKNVSPKDLVLNKGRALINKDGVINLMVCGVAYPINVRDEKVKHFGFVNNTVILVIEENDRLRISFHNFCPNNKKIELVTMRVVYSTLNSFSMFATSGGSTAYMTKTKKCFNIVYNGSSFEFLPCSKHKFENLFKANSIANGIFNNNNITVDTGDVKC